MAKYNTNPFMSHFSLKVSLNYFCIKNTSIDRMLFSRLLILCFMSWISWFWLLFLSVKSFYEMKRCSDHDNHIIWLYDILHHIICACSVLHTEGMNIKIIHTFKCQKLIFKIVFSVKRKKISDRTLHYIQYSCAVYWFFYFVFRDSHAKSNKKKT